MPERRRGSALQLQRRRSPTRLRAVLVAALGLRTSHSTRASAVRATLPHTPPKHQGPVSVDVRWSCAAWDSQGSLHRQSQRGVKNARGLAPLQRARVEHVDH